MCIYLYDTMYNFKVRDIVRDIFFEYTYIFQALSICSGYLSIRINSLNVSEGYKQVNMILNQRNGVPYF